MRLYWRKFFSLLVISGENYTAGAEELQGRSVEHHPHLAGVTLENTAGVEGIPWELLLAAGEAATSEPGGRTPATRDLSPQGI